ncbi:hypothetical protein GIB67_032294 [Kingdonia uniflora]|uniref:Uncharacterized protein n=1 Tax=Kingdonia uniflora TaxID=39325 RepID=A0A7J7MXB8_9MAGN|nr:hypothetical protein GIB67_032294 [Kingdonia uniflora]
MPKKPTKVILGSLLAACNTHGNLRLIKVFACPKKRLFRIPNRILYVMPSEKKIRKLMHYLVTNLEWKFSVVAKHPSLMLRSLEKWIIPSSNNSFPMAPTLRSTSSNAGNCVDRVDAQLTLHSQQFAQAKEQYQTQLHLECKKHRQEFKTKRRYRLDDADKQNCVIDDLRNTV